MLQMKNKTILLIAAAAAVVMGCRQEEELSPQKMEGTILTARIENGVTRTSYDSVEGKFAWNGGDEIAIHYSNGSYETLAVNPTDGSVQAQASTATHQRDYYAVYPASAADAANYGNTALKVTLPNSYDISDIVSGTATGKTSDFSPMPMVAVNAETTSLLDFYHVGGLLRILCSGLSENTHKLTVTFDKDVTGNYTVAFADDGYGNMLPSITTGGTSSNNVVTFTLAETTIGAEPDPANPRMFVLNVPVPCGTYNSVQLSAFDASDTFLSSRNYNRRPMVFARNRGKKVEFGELSFNFYFGTLNNASTTYQGGTRNLSNEFVSYKTDGVTTEPVPFTLEFSEDGGETWSTNAPNWVTPDANIDYNGSLSSDPQSLRMTVKAQVNSASDPHHDELAGRTPKEDFDLSTINVATGETVSTSTANCYVIQAPGTYRFPLVYGNGLKNGAVNGNAFTKMSTTDSQYLLSYYLDHLNNPIKTEANGGVGPYIAAQHEGKTFYARILWTEIPGLVTNAEYHAGIDSDLTDDYISFEVPAEKITQGNALIAIFANDVIAWSWHIWVTEEDMTNVRPGPNNSYYFAPVNLGTVEKSAHQFVGRSCMVRAIQNVSGASTSSTITENGGGFDYSYHSLHYQWGRKDPIRSYNTNNSSDITRFYPSGVSYPYAQVTGTEQTIGTAIQNPTTAYVYYISQWFPQSWCKPTDGFANLWNSRCSGVRSDAASYESVIKTIYDPSPVGYKVYQNLNKDLYTLTGDDATFPKFEATNDLPAGRYYDANGNHVFDESEEAYFPMLGLYAQYNSNIRYYSGSGGYWLNNAWYHDRYGTDANNFSFTADGWSGMGNGSSRDWIANLYNVKPVKE